MDSIFDKVFVFRNSEYKEAQIAISEIHFYLKVFEVQALKYEINVCKAIYLYYSGHGGELDSNT